MSTTYWGTSYWHSSYWHPWYWKILYTGALPAVVGAIREYQAAQRLRIVAAVSGITPATGILRVVVAVMRPFMAWSAKNGN